MPSIQHTPEPAVFRSEKGAINGVASLDSNGLVPNSQLPGATQSAAGTMSAADKTKLDGIATGATANVVSDSLSDTSTTNALSAAKGKALNDSITTLNTHIPYILNVGNIMNLTAETKTSVTKALPDSRTPIAAFVSDYDTYSNTGLLVMRRFSVSNGEITLQFIASAATSYVDVKVCLIY